MTYSWTDDAACQDQPHEWWFAEHDIKNRAKRGEALDRARAICAECPVQQECLDFQLTAVNYAGDFGIWGGTTRRERQKIRHQNGQKPYTKS